MNKRCPTAVKRRDASSDSGAIRSSRCSGRNARISTSIGVGPWAIVSLRCATPMGHSGAGRTTRRFRKIDGLLRFHAAYEDDAPRITFPDGRVIRGGDPNIHAALSEALGQPVTLSREATISHLDAGPLHLLTTASLAWLRSILPDAHIDDRRFRPNMLIDLPGSTQKERLWLGKTLCVGEVILRVRDLTERCVMVNLKQADLPDDSRMLRGLGHDAIPQFGVYAEVLVPGTIKRNDRVLEAS